MSLKLQLQISFILEIKVRFPICKTVEKSEIWKFKILFQQRKVQENITSKNGLH